MIIVKKFKIQNKNIGKNSVFIIAEIGINHLGNLQLCKKMINAAVNAGCDAVKLQIINADESYNKTSASYDYFKNFSLSYSNLCKINEHCQKKKIILFATPGDFSSLDVVKKLKFPAIKISSGLLTNIPLIKEASKLNKPIILSTGMAFAEELNIAIKTVHNEKNNKIAFLDCTSLYPCLYEKINLNRFKNLKKIYIYGFSDHTIDSLSAIVAVSKGAKIIEKHFTISRKLKKGDNKFSMEPMEFKEMITKIRSVEKILINNSQKPFPVEIKNRNLSHRFLAAKKNINKGDKLNLDNVCFMRFGKLNKKLLNPVDFQKLINKNSKSFIKKGDPL